MRKLISALTLILVFAAFATLAQAQSGVFLTGGDLGPAPSAGLGVPAQGTSITAPSLWAHADRVDASQGAPRYEGVVVGEYGSHIQIRADKMRYDPATKAYVLEGNVRLSAASN